MGVSCKLKVDCGENALLYDALPEDDTSLVKHFPKRVLSVGFYLTYLDVRKLVV